MARDLLMRSMAIVISTYKFKLKSENSNKFKCKHAKVVLFQKQKEEEFIMFPDLMPRPVLHVAAVQRGETSVWTLGIWHQ